MAAPILSAQELRALVVYHPDTGAFVRANGRVVAAKPNKHDGYIKFNLRGGPTNYYAHRLAVLYMTGSFPARELEVDHINGDKADNRWANLRVGSVALNQQNKRRAKRGTKCGLLGVSADKSKFVAQIFVNGERHYVGRFRTAESAHAAYLGAKSRLHLWAPPSE